MAKPFISVVVPVYKAEVWLRECIDSILAQTLSNIEIILVDDGSPDNCGAICDEYAKQDSRVRVLHKENCGVSMARKTGVDNATADYISFVDADDTLPSTALADLYQEREGSDIIIGRCSDKPYDREYLTPEEYQSYAILMKHISYTLWARLIARHLFNEITFPPQEIVHTQDALTNIRLAFANKNPVRLVSKNVYKYNNNPNSVTHNFVWSFNYEKIFYKYILDSIPLEQRTCYIKESVMSRLDRLWNMYAHQYRNEWYGTSYYKDLLEDAKLCGYRIPPLERIGLRITNATLLRFYSPVMNCLTYRFGLLKKALTSRNA